MIRLFAVMGNKGSGKSTVADHVVKMHGYKRIKFADPLKKMLSVIGLTHAELEGAMKEEPMPLLCGQSPRHAMQTLGTEWGRMCIGQDLWMNIFKQQTHDYLSAGYNIVNDDCRFVNEAHAVREMGGLIIRVNRGVTNDDTHASEVEMDMITPDIIIDNTGTIDELLQSVDFIISKGK